MTKINKDLSKPFESSTGVKITLKAAPALLIEQAQSMVESPKPPINEIKDEDGKVIRTEENRLHPDFQEALREYDRKRSMAALDAMVMFSVELPAGLPEDESWIKNLKYLERHNLFSLNGYSFDDEDDKEFIYKRYIALGSDELQLVSQINGIRQEDVEAFTDTFQGSA
jgi:hypothetical protein